MDLRLDTLNKQLDEVPQASKESLEQAAVVAALAKVEQQWGKERARSPLPPPCLLICWFLVVCCLYV